jgi:hypothetical protein
MLEPDRRAACLRLKVGSHHQAYSTTATRSLRGLPVLGGVVVLTTAERHRLSDIGVPVRCHVDTRRWPCWSDVPGARGASYQPDDQRYHSHDIGQQESEAACPLIGRSATLTSEEPHQPGQPANCGDHNNARSDPPSTTISISTHLDIIAHGNK